MGEIYKKEEFVICSSSIIERDLLQKAGLEEVQDGTLVPRSKCQTSCQINCPNRGKDYNPPKNMDPPARYKTLSW
jgi:hypothetical protein